MVRVPPGFLLGGAGDDDWFFVVADAGWWWFRTLVGVLAGRPPAGGDREGRSPLALVLPIRVPPVVFSRLSG